MKKTVTPLTVCLFLLPLMLKAQSVSPEVMKMFNGSIITRITGVTSKVNISVKRQIQLGQFFKKQDSLANEAIANGATASSIKDYYQTRDEDLKDILSPLELNDYKVKSDFSSSKLTVTLKYRIPLALTEIQIDRLLSQVATEEKLKMAVGFEIKKFENNQLTKILSYGQYNAVLALIYKEKAQANTKSTWKELNQMGLSKGLDSVKAKADILRYETNVLTDAEKALYAKTPKSIDSARKATAINKPRVLWKLSAYKNTLPKSRFADVMKYNNNIKLGDDQVDTLISRVITLVRMKQLPNGQNNTDKFEIESIFKLLTYSQLNTFLANSNQRKAELNAKKDWQKWKAAGIATDLDSTKVIRSDVAYQINWLMAKARLVYDNSQDKIFAVKDVELNRPLDLKKIDTAYKASTVNKKLKNNLTF